MFAILEEAEGCRNWIHIEPHGTAFISARSGPPPADMLYAERATAERDAEACRAINARKVKTTKRWRKYRIAPATYSVVPIE
jgi:hypothetical protein